MGKLIYSDKLRGSCSKCKAPVSNGGYLSLDATGSVTGMLCKECQQHEEATTDKGMALTVKRLEGSFMQFILKQNMYQVIGSKNMLVRNDVLTEEEINKYIVNPNVTVTIRHG